MYRKAFSACLFSLSSLDVCLHVSIFNLHLFLLRLPLLVLPSVPFIPSISTLLPCQFNILLFVLIACILFFNFPFAGSSHFCVCYTRTSSHCFCVTMIEYHVYIETTEIVYPSLKLGYDMVFVVIMKIMAF